MGAHGDGTCQTTALQDVGCVGALAAAGCAVQPHNLCWTLQLLHQDIGSRIRGGSQLFFTSGN